MQTPRQAKDSPKKYLKQGKSYKRLQFLADKEAQKDLEVIADFYTERMGGMEFSMSILMRRALKTLSNQIRTINRKNSEENIAAFLMLGGPVSE